MKRKWKELSLLVLLVILLTACNQTTEDINTSAVAESENEEVETSPVPENDASTTAVATPAPTVVPEPTAIPKPVITEVQKEAIKESIIRDIGVYNQFIYDHCGWSEDEYGPGPHAKEADPNRDIFCLQIGIMEYMDMLINYISGDYNPDEPLFLWLQMDYYTPIEEQIEEIRGCVFTQTPYNQSHPEDYQNYTLILKNFLEDGHPDVASVENFLVEKVKEIMNFDGHQAGVIATFTCNGESYTCWLEATAGSDEEMYYTVLDLKKNQHFLFLRSSIGLILLLKCE